MNAKRLGKRRVLRALAGKALDVIFDARSPLPCLDGALIESDDLLLLPAPALFEPGNQALGGLAHLVLLARAIDARRIFEIGTYNGLTALVLAANLQDAVVDTLDLPTGSTPQLPLSEHDPGLLSDFTQRRYEGRSEAARITQHLGDSARFDFAPFAGTFDLVYVDGAHSREYVENDTRAAFRIVHPDGIIVWDDYWRRVPVVPKFLHTLTGRLLYRLPDSRIVVCFSEAAYERIVGRPA